MISTTFRQNIFICPILANRARIGVAQTDQGVENIIVRISLLALAVQTSEICGFLF